MAFVYVIKSLKDGNFYIGSTDDLNRRIKDHNSGKNRSTKNRRPFKLVYFEQFDTKYQAEKREKLFKNSHSILYKAAGWEDKSK